MVDQQLKISISAEDKASPEVKKLKAELDTLGKIKSFQDLKRQTSEALREWQTAQSKVKELGVAMKAGGDDAGALKKGFEAAKKEAAQLKSEYIGNRNSLQDLRKSLTAAGVDLKNLSAAQDRLRESTARAKDVLIAQKNLDVKPYKNIQAEIERLRASYETLRKSGTLSSQDLYQAKVKLKEKTAELRKETGDWTTAIGQARAGLLTLAGAGYALIKSFQSYSEFSQRMGEVNTQIDVSRERFRSLSDEIREMTHRIPQSAAELAAAEYDILSAGVALEKSTRALELSAKAAVAGVTDTKTAANVGIGVINAYGKSIDNLDEVYDLLFQTVKLGVTTFPELSQHIGEALPTARAANVELKDLAASIATMTKAGIRTPQATTAIKGAINAMAAPAPEARKQFEALGITWEGLIPTLDAIRKKGLSIDQLRMLIPDVEARTGVLALVQNFDVLKETLEEMDNAAGATEAAYKKMADTPANQLKLLRNEIDDLAISAGELISTGLLPLVKGIRLFMDAVREADPVTKTLIGVLAGAAGGFAIWKLGLGTIVTGLQGLILQSTTAQAAAGTLASQFSSAGIAMKAGLVAAAIYGAVQIGLAAKALYDWGKAANTAKKAQEDMSASTDRTMKKLEGFKDIKLPGDITKLAQQDLEDLRRNLIRAQGYYTALKFSLQEKAKETTFLGTSTDQARAAQKELVGVTARLREIQTDLKTVGEAATGTGVNMEKPAKAVMATSEQLDAFEKQAKKSYANAVKEAEKYAQQVIAWEEKIKYARLSTEDKIRELGRKGLSEELAWNDTRLQADQKLYAAKEALRNGDFELAEKLAKDAEGLYADLAEEVKGADKGDAVVKSIDETKQVAIAGVSEVGKFIEQLYTQQKDNAAASRDKWTETANAINEKLNEIARQREANVQIELKGLEAAQSAIAALVKPATKVVTIVQKTVQASQAGGPIGLSHGAKLPGYGGGDRVDAKLEAGEFVIRKEAVKKYGASLFAALNSMRLDLGDQVKARIGGLISGLTLPAMPTTSLAFQAGGQVPVAGASKETMTIRFQAGGVEMPITAQGSPSVTRQMVKEFEKELIRLGMVKKS